MMAARRSVKMVDISILFVDITTISRELTRQFDHKPAALAFESTRYIARVILLSWAYCWCPSIGLQWLFCWTLRTLYERWPYDSCYVSGISLESRINMHSEETMRSPEGALLPLVWAAAFSEQTRSISSIGCDGVTTLFSLPQCWPCYYEIT